MCVCVCVCAFIFARTVHSCSQTAPDIRPMYNEVLVVKIWSYFHQYTVFLVQFNSIFGFIKVQHKKLFQYGNAAMFPFLSFTEKFLEFLRTKIPLLLSASAFKSLKGAFLVHSYG